MTSARLFIDHKKLEQAADGILKRLKVCAEAWVDTLNYFMVNAEYDALLTSFCTHVFYSAAALLAMQSAVLATAIPSVRLSVSLSVTRWY